MSGTHTHGRLPWPGPDELTSEQRTVYDAVVLGPRASGNEAVTLTDPEGRLEGPFNAMLLNPAVGAALQALGSAIRYGTALTGRARELAILEVAVATRSGFEWYAHERLGRRAGLTGDEIDCIRRGADMASLDAEEAAVRELVRDVLRRGDLDDDRFERGVEALGLRAVTDLVYLVGYYQMLALAMRAARVPLPASAGPVEW